MKPPVLPKRFRSLSRAAIFALLGLPLHAATVTWDNSAATNAWSTPANWDTNVEPLAADDVVLAAGLGATLNLLAGENAKSLQFDAIYTLTGGGLTLASASTIGVLLGQVATISTPLTITGGTTKTGDGVLTLSGTNTFTGGIIVSAGTLRVSHASALGAATNVATVNAGAVLEVTSTITLDRAITLNNGGTVAGSGAAISNGKITIDALATAVTLGTVASGDLFTVGNGANDLTGGTAATTINVAGPGTVRLGAASDFDGSWMIPTGARLELGATAALGDTASSGVTLAGGTLVPRLNTATTFTGPTNLTMTANSLIVSDRSSTGSGVAHTLGTLAIGTNTLTVTPGANVNSGVGGIVLGSVTLSGNPTFAVGNSGNAGAKLTTGALLGGGVARTITKTGTGDLALTGGATDLLAGSQVNVSGGGNLDLLFPALGAGASVAVSDAQHPLGAASFAMTGGTLNLLADGDNTAAAQTFVLANGLTLSGTTVVDPARRSGTGNTTKTFELPTLTLGAGAVVGIGGANTYGLRVSGATTLLGNATLQGTALATRSGALTLNGAIGDGGGGFALSIAGGTSVLNLTLNAVSTYSGGTNVSGSTVTLNAANALGSGGLVQSGGTLTANTTGAINGAVSLSSGSLTLNAANAIGGAIVISGGTLRANGTAAIQTNPVSLNGGTLDLRTNVVATFTTGTFTLGGDATMNFANNGSGTNFTPTFGSALNIAGNRTLTVTNANGHTPNFANIALAGDLTLSSGIAVSVQAISQDATPRRFIKAGAGTTTLTGAGTFTGGAEVLAGILSINDTTALGTSVLTVGDTSGVATAQVLLGVGPSLPNDIVVRAGSSGAATLRTTVSGLTWAGNIALQRTGTLETTSLATFSGILSGVGNVNKTGSGEIIFANAANSFGSGTAASVNITAGTLTVDNDGALGNAANGVTIAASTTFRANGTFTSARNITPGAALANIDVTTGNALTLTTGLSGNSTFTKQGLGTLAFGPAATSARTAAMTINDGTLQLGGATSIGTASPITIAGGTLDLRNDANTNYAHPLTIASGTNIVNVDRAVGGAATGGTHTLGTVALNAQTLNTTGANGFGLALGAVGTTGSSTLNHDAPGALNIAAINLGGTSGTLTFTMDGDGGDVFVVGLIEDNVTPIWNFAKRGSHTLHLGTGFATDGTVTIADGTLDLNGLNVALQSSLTIGGGALATAAQVTTGTGALTLGGALTYSSNSTLLGANIVGNLDLGAATRTFTINDSTGAAVDLNIIGPISGPAGIGFTKVGAGTLRLSGGSNTLTGLTTVQAGTLELNKNSDAIGIGGLSINTNSSTAAIARLVASNQINDAAAVAITNTSGIARLDLAGFSETLGATAITATTTSGALITTGAAGTLVLGGDLTLANNVNLAGFIARRALITGSGSLGTTTLDGTLDLGGAVRNVAVTSTVVGANLINANALIETVIINGGIQKTGPQTLFLTNPGNTFAGGLRIAQGAVSVTADGAQGTGTVTLNNTGTDSAAFQLGVSNQTVASNIVVSNTGTGEARLDYFGALETTATFNGSITLNSNLVIQPLQGNMNDGEVGLMVFNGVIDDGAGTFGIIKKGDGGARLTNANTFGGGLFIEKGTLSVANDAALGAAAVPVSIGTGVLHAEGSFATARELIFTTNGSVRVDGGDVLELTGALTHGGNTMGFFGSGTTVLTGTSSGFGTLLIGLYASEFSGSTFAPNVGYGHVVSVRGGFTLPVGNIWLQNGGVLELGTGNFSRPLGNAPGQVRMETAGGAGFAAFGADRLVNLGGPGVTLIWGDPVTKFLRGDTGFGFENSGALILGSTTATHTVTFQNPLEFNNGDSNSGRTIDVPDGPAAKEAVISGDLSLTGPPGTPGIFLELNVEGALDITGNIRGVISLTMFAPGTLTLTGANTFTGFVTIDGGGTLNVTSDAAMGDAGNELSLFNSSTLQAGANLTIHRTIQISSFGGPANIIDTNGFDVLLDTDSAVVGGGGEVVVPEFLEKIGAGTLTLRGLLEIDGLTTSAGTTNLETELGSGTSILNANAETNITVDQILEELNIGPGATVTLGAAAPAPAFAQAVPEPGSFALLLLGALGLAARRRRV